MQILENNAIVPIENLEVALKQWIFGLSWQRTSVGKQNFLDKLQKKNRWIDLDLSCLLYDEFANPLERIWFKNIRDNAEAIYYYSDNLQGVNVNVENTFNPHIELEKIDIFFDKIAKKVQFITLILSSFDGHSLSKVTNGFCHLSDDESNIITQFDLTHLPIECTAFWVATLSRNHENVWNICLNKQPLQSYHLPEFEQEIQKYLIKSLN